MEISSRTLIPLFRSGLVHSSSASWDDCDRVFPDELCVSSFPNRFHHDAWTALFLSIPECPLTFSLPLSPPPPHPATTPRLFLSLSPGINTRQANLMCLMRNSFLFCCETTWFIKWLFLPWNRYFLCNAFQHLPWSVSVSSVDWRVPSCSCFEANIA